MIANEKEWIYMTKIMRVEIYSGENILLTVRKK